jgi:hypothetical protein
VRERAAWLVLEQQAEHGSQCASSLSVSAKIDCAAQSPHHPCAVFCHDPFFRPSLSNNSGGAQ